MNRVIFNKFLITKGQTAIKFSKYSDEIQNLDVLCLLKIILNKK